MNVSQQSFYVSPSSLAIPKSLLEFAHIVITAFVVAIKFQK